MALPVEFIERLKDANPIEEIIGSYVTLKRTGRDFVCLCPFHNEKTPSCHVHPGKEYFHCFGCGAGGVPRPGRPDRYLSDPSGYCLRF